MKTYRVHRIYVLHIVLFYSVTLERVFLFLSFRCRVQILYRNAAFDTAQYVTLKKNKHSKTDFFVSCKFDYNFFQLFFLNSYRNVTVLLST